MSARNRITRHRNSQSRELARTWTTKWLWRWDLVRAFRKQCTPILKVPGVPARAACYPIWLSVRTLKASEWSEHLGLSNAGKLFLPILLIVPSDTSTEQQFLVASCMILASEEQRLEGLTAERIGDRTIHTSRLSTSQKPVFLENFNRSIWLKRLTHKAVGNGDSVQAPACHFPSP